MNEFTKSVKDIYPKSSSGYQCIGPCYFKKTQFIHPLTLDELQNDSLSICPIIPTSKIDKKSKKRILIEHDKCSNPTHKKTEIDDIFIDTVLTPITSFNVETFVKIYYDIKSLEELFQYLEDNKHLPYKTKLRLFDFSFKLYGKNLNILNETMIDFVYEIIEKNIKKIVMKTYYYFEIEDNIIKTTNEKNNNIDIKKHYDIIKKYILDNLLNIEKTKNILLRFIRNENNRLNDYKLSEIIISYIISYIIKKIYITNI